MKLFLLVQACPGNSVDRRTDPPAMTLAVDLGRKATKQANVCYLYLSANQTSFYHGINHHEH